MLDEQNLEVYLNFMTRVQRRRWRKRLNGLTVQEIAASEGVTYQAIRVSLISGMAKISKNPVQQLKKILESNI